MTRFVLMVFLGSVVVYLVFGCLNAFRFKDGTSTRPVASIKDNNLTSEVEVLKKYITVMNENGNMDDSENADWWLNSGGKAVLDEDSIRTIQGSLSSDDRWAIEYRRTNPDETDNGTHPQNIFRLVSRKKYQNVIQEVKFKINNYNLSNSTHRTASNGVLFFHHYINGDNLYYAGLRVDGTAVIKKKINGIYYTMDQKTFTNSDSYDREINPNLLPIDRFIGIKTEISNIDPNAVSIKLYADLDNSSTWNLIAESIDDGTQFGGKAITSSGYVGIRSDFMDAEFSGYSAISKQ